MSAMVDGILCRTVVDSVPNPSVNPTSTDGSIEYKSCTQLSHFAGRIDTSLSRRSSTFYYIMHRRSVPSREAFLHSIILHRILKNRR